MKLVQVGKIKLFWGKTLKVFEVGLSTTIFTNEHWIDSWSKGKVIFAISPIAKMVIVALAKLKSESFWNAVIGCTKFQR